MKHRHEINAINQSYMGAVSSFFLLNHQNLVISRFYMYTHKE